MFTVDEIKNKVFNGNCLDILKKYPSDSVDCCVTSPPYYKKRAYGTNYQIWDGDPNCKHNWEICDNLLKHKRCTKCNAWLGELGQEPKPEDYIRHLVEIFTEFKRVMKSTGTLWINIGDTFYNPEFGKHDYLKPKDLIGIPWLLAIDLQKKGYYLRNDIIWCLGGDTNLYVRTKDSGDVVMTIKDMARLNPKNLQLWNGKKWTNVLGISKNKKQGNEIELVLRSGEKIVCTPNHQWPTTRGLLEASKLKVGDIIDSCYLTMPFQNSYNNINIKNSSEIIKIGKARSFGYYVYDIGVEDEPHIFALASGVLTHNSKPNPMPRSVTDRCTESHEYILFFTKEPNYYFNMDKIRDPMITKAYSASKIIGYNKDSRTVSIDENGKIKQKLRESSCFTAPNPNGKIKRDVWECNVISSTKSLTDVKSLGLEYHHAMYSEDLIEPCIKGGCPEGGLVFDPFMGSGTTAVVALKNKMYYTGTELNDDYLKIINKRINTIDLDKINGNNILKEFLTF